MTILLLFKVTLVNTIPEENYYLKKHPLSPQSKDHIILLYCSSGPLSVSSLQIQQEKTMKRLLPLFLILLTLVAVSCDNSTPKKTEPEVKKYTVTFDPDNGEKTTTVEVESGKTVSAPEKEPVKTDTLGFAEWLTADGSDFDFDETPVTKDMTFKAYYFKSMGEEQEASAKAMMIFASLLYKDKKLDDIDNTAATQLFGYMSKLKVDEDGRPYYSVTEGETTTKYYFSFSDTDTSETKYAYVGITKKEATVFKGESRASEIVKDAYDSVLSIQGLKIYGYFTEGVLDSETKAITEKTDNPAFSTKDDNDFIVLPAAVIASTYEEDSTTKDTTPLMLSLLTATLDGKTVMFSQINTENETAYTISMMLRIGTDFYKKDVTNPKTTPVE